MMTEDQKAKIAELAQRVLEFARNTLTIRLRFMDAAIGQLEAVPQEEAGTTTNGEVYFYHPVDIIRQYQKGREYPVRSYLHTLLHCVYRHMFVKDVEDVRLWELACDIAVEHTINDLSLEVVHIDREEQQREVTKRLSGQVKYMTAEMIGAYLQKAHLDEETLRQLEELFRQDDHTGWYMTEDENGKRQGRQRLMQAQHDGEDDALLLRQMAYREALAQMWKSVSENIQTALETLERERGMGSPGLTMNIREVNRERYDYSTFLQKFAVRGEVMKVSPDEFDHIYYTYGLSLYENVPLVEPLEYSEVKRIREFVIALDTSGSTCISGEDKLSLVQRFVQKTYNILKSTESFFTQVNIHIIQCDDTIQEDVKITSQEEFDAYLKVMQLHGAGGTDFRPVFRYVDQLIEQKEFTNLRGMIYFTDLFGTFPEKQPDYQTAFVYFREDHEEPEVPPWAIKLVLDKI